MNGLRNRLQIFLSITILCAFTAGCSGMQGNVGNMSKYETPVLEAEWIVDGEPIEFEETLWYPQDSVDILLDSEVYLLGEYRGVQFFVEKVDVRPYNYLYTKFDRNKFRMFRKNLDDD